MNCRILFSTVALLPVVALSAEPNDPFIWKASVLEGEFSDVANWTGVPTGVSSIAYDSLTEYWLEFFGNYGPARPLQLTLNQDLRINRIYLQWENATINLDLGGHKLQVFGRDMVPMYNHKGWLNQTFVMSNGTLDFADANRTSLAANGTAKYVFKGTEENPFCITNAGAVAYSTSEGGSFFFTNTVFSSEGKFQLTSQGNFIFSGPKTKLKHHGTLYPSSFGITSAADSYFELSGGAVADCVSEADKATVTVGDTRGGNTMVVTGMGTSLYATNWFSASDGGVSDIAVGKQSDGNTLIIDNHAKVMLTSRIIVGNPAADTDRASSCNNTIRIDNGATVSAASFILGQTANRNGYSYGCTGVYTNNVCEISRGATVTCTDSSGGLRVGTEANVDDSRFVLSEGAVVSAHSSSVGSFGVGNSLSILSGAVLKCPDSAYNRGLDLGGTSSAGATVVVDGGIIAHTNAIVRLRGATTGNATKLLVKGGGFVRTAQLEVEGANNVVEISGDGRIEVGVGARYEFAQDDGNGVEFRFSGSNPVLKHLWEDPIPGESGARIGFGTGSKLVFAIPEDGYAEPPIQGALFVYLSGSPEVSFAGSSFTGKEQVLMEVPAGRSIFVSDDAIAAMQSKLVEAGEHWILKLTDGNRRLVAKPLRGTTFFFR